MIEYERNYCIYCGYNMSEDHFICPVCKSQPFPKTYVGKLIADKWFLPMSELAKRTGVKVESIRKILKGAKCRITERRLVAFLESYKGEYEE